MQRKIAFMGTPNFAVPILKCIYHNGYEVSAVYTQPPKKSNRGQKLNKSPINLFSENISLKIRTPNVLKNTDKFYKDLNIKNLNTYFDNGLKLVKVFTLRGVPTTIIFNKNKEMVARISGSVDFEDEKFVSWLNSIK